MFSLIYRAGLFLHRKLTPAKRAQVAVISVGNISLGGTGKTPVVMEIIRDLKDRADIAVVSRGYGRKTRRLVEVKPNDDYTKTGDEALMIKKRFPNTPVIVERDRYKAACRVKKKGADVLVLDDGFQSWEIKKDLEIVLVDSGSPFAGGRLLPFGRLRESPRALRRADVIVITRCNDKSEKQIKELTEKLNRYAPSAEIFRAEEKIEKFINISGSREASPESFKGKKIMCFSAIGNNRAFHRLLSESGLKIIKKQQKVDHYDWKEEEVKDFSRQAESKGLTLITTEKDAVKLAADSSLPLWYVQMGVSISNKEKWRKKLDEAVSRI